MAVRIKTEQEIALMREGGKRLAGVMARLKEAALPGVSTGALDELAERLMREAGGDPVFQGYRIPGVETAYPASICTSINDEVVHGIPQKNRMLASGDIIGIDIGMRWRGFVTDMAVTVGIGEIAPDALRLITATKESLDIGIAAVRPGAKIGDISHAVEQHLKKAGLGVIRDLAGHGVGHELHEEPLIPNFGKAGKGMELREGMAIAIEPMATLGGWRIALDRDEWMFRTSDGSLAAHFEHTVAVTSGGYDILTLTRE
ncbi:MAG: type I methionyl aminopeptidase [Candidatus Sungbacteria bacterium]|nr:type I methionyl aminopeptidase [Candidatus Sungbacteria bacterium]